MAFLALLKDVLVAAIDESNSADLAPVEDVVVAHLGRHCVKTRGENFDRDGADVGNQLLTLASDFEADLVIAGAYGHTRFREWAFGGVTRDLPSELPTTLCLLSN